MIWDRPARFSSSARGVDKNGFFYLVTLHDAEASHAPIRCAKRFDGHPTLIWYTTMVQCADTATEFAIGPIDCLHSADVLHLESIFDGD